MNASEMRSLLTARGIHLTRSLGQNFMHDARQLSRLIDLSELSRSDRVLEIGPGLGPLTGRLLSRAGEVRAIEIDGRLCAYLRESLGDSPQFDLREADALKYLRESHEDWSDWKLIANLPYSIASPMMVEFALNESCPSRMVLTLQWEVFERLKSGPGSRDYGVLTLLVGYRYELTEWFRIAADSFFPKPKVDSAGVVLVRRLEPIVPDELRRCYVKVVKRAFSQRRKMMRKLLRADWPEARVDEAISRLDLPAGVRGEALSIEQFAELTRLLAGTGSPDFAESSARNG